MKLLLFTTLGCLLQLVAISQAAQEPAAILFSNGAFRSFYAHNSDSTVYYIRKLADSSTFGSSDLFTDFIHKPFAQEFGYRNLNGMGAKEVKTLNNTIALRKQMLYQLHKDTSQKIQRAVSPICLAVQVKDSIHNSTAVRRLVTDFISRELSGDIYLNRQARYGLYIYNLMHGNKELRPVADRLFECLKSKLMSDQAAIGTNKSELEKRASYRYLYAYVCSVEAEQTTDQEKKGRLLQQAFQNSPDFVDMSNKGQFYYDMIFLFNEEKCSFREGYLHFLQNGNGSKDEIFDVLSSMAVLDVQYKQQLKSFYIQNYATGKPFDRYWLQLLEKEARENAPLIRLTLLNEKTISSEDGKGKWMLIDFWGTWCGPCRMEHPDLEKFYRSVVLLNSNKISLLTIACKDTQERVVDYIKEKGFSFPVAMSDNTVEKLYNVQSYPTKILITPAGNYMIIPFGFDWTTYVKQIIDL